MNYYHAHKNKKTKRLPKRKPNKMSVKTAKAALVSVMGATQFMLIESQPIRKGDKDAKIEKELAIFNSITNTAISIIKALSPDYLDNFKLTGRYGRKPKQNTLPKPA